MSTQDTLKDRQTKYGEFTENAEISQKIKDIFREYPRFIGLTPDKKEALDIIASKVSRILTGDPEYSDNWHDIQGYAKLIENKILTGSSYKEPTKKSR